ncbi:phage tail sheath family protein [Solirubrobacter soli]|uniref:phage tail sheath family protein n=1 Tax=Solirubrobacter soli TaxID=363832 RepID=UPI0003FB5D1C|nr:phage tail sheath C-terminal domain-containing protein [Solirubrobacter soli]
MAVTPTYPGVYLSETQAIPRSVTPATTNLTAFLGDFPQGPISSAVLVTSWPEFASVFGALSETSSLAAYGVWQFFQNGGIGAWIVRLPAPGATPGKVLIDSPTGDGQLEITANGPGAWSASVAVAFNPSMGSKTHVDFVVSTYVKGNNPSPPPAIETIPNIALTHADGTPLTSSDMAAVIDNGSSLVTAAAATGTGLATPAPLNGTDGTFNDNSLVSAVEAAVVAGGLLDQIAPAVFNIMCIPDLVWNATVFGQVHSYCEARQAFLLVDPPAPSGQSVAGTDGLTALLKWANGGFLGPDNVAAAVYYPWLEITDPVTQYPKAVPPSGTVAGVYATTDVTRGVWKAPAGTTAALAGVNGLTDVFGDVPNGELNPSGINCLRTFPLYGSVVWGARTLAGSDLAGSAFKYVSSRRLADFIEQSLSQSLRWAVFEPNGPALWSSVSVEVTSFMAGLFGQGAFAGATAAAAYQVVCDATTTSTLDQLAGVVNVNVSFAPVDPAEFVMLNITIEAASSAS